MEFVQERIATLHDLTGRTPSADLDRVAVVLPMTEREHAALAAERMLSSLGDVAPGRVIVALRCSPDRIQAYREWLSGFDVDLEVFWTTGPALRERLAEHDLDGSAGKGRDVWMALGIAAADHPYVVCHDADAKSFTPSDINRLAAPLQRDFSFTKGYYARIEDNRLYGRLLRLFYVPLIRTLHEHHDAPILEYLGAFRYALAGEFGATAELATRFRIERRFGLEIGTLGDAFDHAGFDGTAQVDLGRYEHEHRAVSGPTGLTDMCEEVAAALFRVIEDHDIVPDYSALQSTFRTTANDLLRMYAADAAFNGLTYDPEEEREQIEVYAEAIHPTSNDDRLPPWRAVDLTPEELLEASRTDLAAVD